MTGKEVNSPMTGTTPAPIGNCITLINNGPSSNKVDLVFIGDGYDSNSEFETDVLYLLDYSNTNSQNYPGLFSYEPFKSNKNKFNIRIIAAGNAIKHNGNKPDVKNSRRFSQKCPSTEYVVVISKKVFGSFADMGYRMALVSFGLVNPCDSDGKLLTHEFGHAFGKLNDEYVYSPGHPAGIEGDIVSNIRNLQNTNCVTTENKARRLWGILLKVVKKNITLIKLFLLQIRELTLIVIVLIQTPQIPMPIAA